MARRVEGPIPPLQLGAAKDGGIKIRTAIISYADDAANDTTTVSISGLAESDKPVSITIDFFLYSKAGHSDCLTHQAIGPTPLPSIPRRVAGGFIVSGKGKRPVYATAG